MENKGDRAKIQDLQKWPKPMELSSPNQAALETELKSNIRSGKCKNGTQEFNGILK